MSSHILNTKTGKYFFIKFKNYCRLQKQADSSLQGAALKLYSLTGQWQSVAYGQLTINNCMN